MKKIIGCICVLLLSYVAVKPLLSPGYFPMHDDTQVARVVVMGKALKQGQFPVRWVSDLGYGYGYPIFNFYGPLPYYIGGGLYALGVDAVVATKIMFGIGMVLAGVTLFLLVESLFGFLAAITAGILFLYAPYHAVEVYIRGAVGEYWAIAFVPLILSGIWHIYNKNRKNGLILAAVGFAGLILSHTILGFITTVILTFSILVYLIRKRDWYLPAFVMLGLGLSAFFWLPAIVEMSSTSVSQMIAGTSTTFFDHFVCLTQLWNSPWGFAGSAPGCIDGMSFKLGKVQLIMFVCSLIAWIVLQKKQNLKEKNKFMMLSVSGLAVCVFLMLQLSTFVWKLAPFTSFIQYPWRLLSFGMMFVALSGAYIVAIARKPIVRIILAAGIITITIVVNAKIFVPQYTYVRDSYAFSTQEELRFTKSKISDEYLPPGVAKPLVASDIVKTALEGNDTFSVNGLQEKDTSLYAELESDRFQTIAIRKAWFPGWKITINGKPIDPSIERGIPSVNIPIGMSIIQMKFTNTPVRTLGNILSVCSAIVIGALYVYGKKTKA